MVQLVLNPLRWARESQPVHQQRASTQSRLASQLQHRVLLDNFSCIPLAIGNECIDDAETVCRFWRSSQEQNKSHTVGENRRVTHRACCRLNELTSKNSSLKSSNRASARTGKTLSSTLNVDSLTLLRDTEPQIGSPNLNVEFTVEDRGSGESAVKVEYQHSMSQIACYRRHDQLRIYMNGKERPESQTNRATDLL